MANPDDTKPMQILDPPRRLGGILLRLGPGLIIAGSIVGSGELIATTSVGAEAGFALLWLILIGCFIKVFVQVELGRHTVTWGQTPLEAMDGVPGPRLRVNWIVWAWAIMTLLIICQQGGIIGGVGQAMAIRFPLTEHGAVWNDLQNEFVAAKINVAQQFHDTGTVPDDAHAQVATLGSQVEQLIAEQGSPLDAKWWATIIAVFTSVLLFIGRYGLIQGVSTIFVAGFTMVTILTLFLLQRHDAWAISGAELASGLKFSLPPSTETVKPINTALAAFGIIGVGASELMIYPYWCMEKGYAKFTGPRDGSEAWTQRAKGWMRIMQFDAWGSMVVYTFSTAAFYLLGAAVLWKVGLVPASTEMVRTLSQMYVPVFDEWAATIFLLGAVAVLYSTFFVAAAGNSRMVADGCRLFGCFGRRRDDEKLRMEWTRVLSTIWPLVAVALYWFIEAPKQMILASGAAQAIMLPVVGIAALYFRYKKCDPALRPKMWWDILLWISFLGFIIASGWTLATKFGLV